MKTNEDANKNGEETGEWSGTELMETVIENASKQLEGNWVVADEWLKMTQV